MRQFNIIAALMVKNESKRILVSLESVKTSVSGVVVFDTGSTDDTVDKASNYSKQNGLNFYLLTGDFEDFSTSRNKMLNFVDDLNNNNKKCNKPIFDYIILLDSNDEYKSKKPFPDFLRDLCAVEKWNMSTPTNNGIQQFEGNAHVYCKIKKRKLKKQNTVEETHKDLPDAFMVKQKWFIGEGKEDLSYFNIKIIKPNKGYKYVEPVHEYIKEPANSKTYKINEGVEFFQDRVADNDGKTRKRWQNDVNILKKVLESKPNDARTQYYLAQTYGCLENKQEALKYYKTRAKNTEGFYEERFLSMLQCGYLKKGYDSVKWFLQAYELCNRAEPLIEVAKFFRFKKQFYLAYCFSKLACDLPAPVDCLLWSNKKIYTHDRWQELAISAYYIKRFDEGEKACRIALSTNYDKELNTKNLDFYIQHKKIQCNSGLEKP